MKKTLIAIVVIIIILAAGWTGVTWYTSSKFESQMALILTSVNKGLAGHGAQISYRNYQRGFFTSHFQLVITVDKSTAEAHAVDFVFDETLDHGPFPLSQLKRFNLIPTLAVLESVPVKTPNLQKLFAAYGEKPYLTMSSRLGYAFSEIVSDITFTPLNYHDDDRQIDFAGGKLHFMLSGDISKGEITSTNFAVQLGKFTSAITQGGKPEKLSFDGIITHNELTRADKLDMYTGKSSIEVNNFSYLLNNKPFVTVGKTVLMGKSALTDDSKNINEQVNYKMSDFNFNGQSVGSGEFNFKIDNINAQALINLKNNLMSKNETADPFGGSQLGTALSSLALIQNNTSIQFDPIIWRNSEGEMSYKLKLTLNNLQSIMTRLNDPVAAFKSAVKSVDSHLILPEPAATKFLSQINQMAYYKQHYKALLEDNQQDMQSKLLDLHSLQVQATADAIESLRYFAALGQKSNLIKYKNDIISSDFTYADGKVQLNGVDMTLEQLVEMVN